MHTGAQLELALNYQTGCLHAPVETASICDSDLRRQSSPWCMSDISKYSSRHLGSSVTVLLGALIVIDLLLVGRRS